MGGIGSDLIQAYLISSYLTVNRLPRTKLPLCRPFCPCDESFEDYNAGWTAVTAVLRLLLQCELLLVD